MTGGTVTMSSWRQFDKIEDKVGSRSEAWSDLLALPARPKLSSSSEDLFGRTLDTALDGHTTLFGLASAPAQPRARHPWRQNSLADTDNGSSATRQQHQQQQPLYSPQLRPSSRPDPFWPGPAPEISGPPVLDPAVNHETYRRAAVDFVLELAGPPQVVSPSGGVSKPIDPDSPRHVSADELPVPAFAVDRDTRCTVWNRRLAQLSGWEEAEVMNMADFAAELFAVDSSQGRSKACKELLRSAFFGRDALGVPFWLVTKAGNGCRRCVPVHLHAAQRTDAVGAASGVLCVVFPAAAPSTAAAGAAMGGTTAATGALQLGHGFAAPVVSDGAENSYSCLFGTTRGPSMDSTTSSSSISQCSRGGGSDAGLLFGAPTSCCTFRPDSADHCGGGGGSSNGVRGADSGKHSRPSGHHLGFLGSSTPPFDYHERHMFLGLPRPPSTGALRTVGGGLVFPDLDPFRRRASFGLRYSADSLTSCDSVGSFGWQTSISAASALNQDWPAGSPPPARCPPSPPPTPYLPPSGSSSAEIGLSPAAASSLIVPAPAPSGHRAASSGVVRALVMDSVDAVRNEMALSLERCGLDVVCAASLREAMWRFERALAGMTDDGPRFDVVFLELQQATGAEVYIAIRDLRRLEEEANLLQEPTLHPQHHHAQEQEQEQEGQLEEGEEEELSEESEDGRPLVEAAGVEGSPDPSEAEGEGEWEGGEEAGRALSQSEAVAANEGCNLVNKETEAKAGKLAEAEAEAEAEAGTEAEVEAGAEVDAEAGEEGGEDPPRCLILAMANMNRWDLAGLDVATAQCVRAGGDAVIPRNMPLQQLRVALRKLGIRSKYLMFPPRLPRALSGNLHNPLNLSR